VTIEAVIFDWGGTLTEPLEPLLGDVAVWHEAARALLPEREEEVVQELIAAEEELWELSRLEHRSSRLADLFSTAAQRLGVEIAEALLDEIHEAQLERYRPHIHHDPNAVRVLEGLRSRGLKLGLLSNTLWPGSFHESLLEADGLGAVLDERIYTSELHVTKPHPEAFHAILEALGVGEAGRAVFVGDRPWDDIFGAQRAGLRTVHRPRATVPSHDVEPDAVITELPELLTIVDLWSR